MGASYAYDGGNRLTSLADNVGPGGMQLHSYAYTYDGSGNRKTIAEDGATTTYTYDGDNQLTGATVGTTTTSYSYDAHHNRTAMVTSAAGTTSYSYDAAGIELTQLTDPAGIVTSYAYDDATGNLTSSTRDPSGAHAVTSYTYGANGGQPNVLSGVTKPDGTTISFSYDADGNRISTTVTSGSTTTTVKDVYQLGLVAYETDGAGTLLATFTYDSEGVPASVQVGSDPATAPRYYYVYNGHGDVVALVDSAGATVASYSYDAFGVPQAGGVAESFANGWTNPYRYDGKDRVRYDAETGLYWMSVRAYDPAIGRFLSRDPLGRAPLFFADQPYVYAGNNPLVNVDPSGQWFSRSTGAATNWTTYRAPVRVQPARPQRQAGSHPSRRDGHPRVLGEPGKQPGMPRDEDGSHGSFLSGFEHLLHLAVGFTYPFGLQIAFRKGDVLASKAYLARVLENFLSHNHIAKDPARYARRTAEMQLEEGLSETLEKFDGVLAAIGFFADWGLTAADFYRSRDRPDLIGFDRLATAVLAGLFHAAIVTSISLGGAASLEEFGPIAAFAGGLFGGWIGGKLADIVTPRAIDLLVPLPAYA